MEVRQDSAVDVGGGGGEDKGCARGDRDVGVEELMTGMLLDVVVCAGQEMFERNDFRISMMLP